MDATRNIQLILTFTYSSSKLVSTSLIISLLADTFICCRIGFSTFTTTPNTSTIFSHHMIRLRAYLTRRKISNKYGRNRKYTTDPYFHILFVQMCHYQFDSIPLGRHIHLLSYRVRYLHHNSKHIDHHCSQHDMVLDILNKKKNIE
jgi:hypothetical protein